MSTRTFQIAVPRRRRETFTTKTGGEGYRWVDDGVEFVRVEVTIDIEGVASRLGRKAWKNKGKRVRGLGGAIIVTAERARS